MILPNLQSLLRAIPDELKPIAAVGIGALLLVGIVLFHGIGLHRILLLHTRADRRLSASRLRLTAITLLFGQTVFLMLAMHLADIVIWGCALLYFGFVPRVQNAFYFCANAYTTVGYGNVDLGEHWRYISPIISISGLFTFAWTTSALVNVVGTHSRLLNQLESEREKEMSMRAAARQAEREAHTSERETEIAPRERVLKKVKGMKLSLERYVDVRRRRFP